MYEDVIAALLGDMQIDMPSGRASALRGQPFSQSPMVPPPQGMAPPPMLPQPMPPGPPPAAPQPPQATLPPGSTQTLPQQGPGPAPGPIGNAQPGPMLPQALAQQRPPPPPQAPDPYDAQAALLQRQHDSAMTDLSQALQPPNTGPMQEAYRARAQQSPKYLLAAMAAQHAGMPDFAKHHMQQAASVDEPMKTATGTMTPQGFIEDPAYGQAMKVRSAEARVTAIERAQAQNISAAERRRLEKDKEEAKAELATQLAAYHRGTAVMVKGMTAGPTGEGGFGGAETQVGIVPGSKDPVYRHTKTGQLFTYQNGSPTPYKGSFEPKSVGSGQPTEGERKSSVLLQRLEFSEQQLKQAVKENPEAAKPSILVRGLEKLPIVGEDLANTRRSSERQRVETAQLDLLDAALTLGTGAAYTNEQLKGYAKSYFPQLGDDDATVADKAARLENVIKAARTAAGRAAVDAPTPPSVTPPTGPPGQGPLSQQEKEELLLLRQKHKVRG